MHTRFDAAKHRTHKKINVIFAAVMTIGLLSPFACSLIGMSVAFAQEAHYPQRAIRMVVGFPPGQATDIVARTVAEKLSLRWGQSVVIDNKPGAAGIIGTEQMLKAPADGYTVLMSSSGPLAINPGLYSKLPYDPIRDIQPIAMGAVVPLFLVVHPSLPVQSVQELISLARARPGKINYASGGSGLTNHLAMEMLKSAANIDLMHIPYKGGPPAVTDLIAGQVQVMFETGPGILPHVKAGKVRALGVGSIRRSASMPELPTVAESGISGFDGVAWIGLVAARGVPKAIIEKLNHEVNAIVALPDVRERFMALGAEAAPRSADEFDAYMRQEITKWGKAIRDSGAKVD